MNNFSSRMDGVQSPIIPIVGQLIRENKGTISLGQGVVYYAPPPAAIEAINDFLNHSSNHQYKSVQGIDPLINRIVNKLAEDNQIIINDNQAILVTAGGNMAFINALLAITNAGDEIILNTPYYFNHEMAITMANCQPILVNTDETYQLNLNAIKAAITPKTRAVVTISPNNPTGVVYSESSLREVNQLCQEKGIYHISDEAYEYFTYNGVKHFSPASIIGSENHTISLYSLSKAYGFASWRIGYMVMPKHLLDGVKKIQDTILICPPVISQYAALGALNTGKAYCHQYLSEINEVRDVFLQSLHKLKDICTIINAEGAFYIFLKVNTQINDFELVKQLIEQYKIAVLPGGTFGMKEGCYLRIAYGSLQKETAIEGIERLVKGLRNLVS
ncbi:pyridoxal phosphate-dependent aminotransferase [Crocosphaera sp. XPORK-15E]|uniref:pyridoxal phosphate-dependent aminotransferase n=1 Tax=Crocosphaera sp. XPORK-15E TaxID=3110247 RepID=UPI002B218C5A|nr:pyridoxal phosphate-dependent aminotransferase [Crocosphaera sp. XPORK-15E]MEA5535009.1 pyridoxal phosphate-dependent aminotransferase [Crocosphaera sp. XPORK-15E]